MKVRILNPTRIKKVSRPKKNILQTTKQNTMRSTKFRSLRRKRRTHNPTVSITKQGISSLLVDAGSSVAGGIVTQYGYNFLVNQFFQGQRPSAIMSLVLRAGIPLGLGYFLHGFNSQLGKAFMLGGLGYAGTQAFAELSNPNMMRKVKQPTGQAKKTLKGYDLSLGELADFEEVGEIEAVYGEDYEDMELVGEIEAVNGDEYEDFLGAASSGSSSSSNTSRGISNDSRHSYAVRSSGYSGTPHRRQARYGHRFDIGFNPYQTNTLP